MHWLLFIHKMLFSFTCFESQVLIRRRIQLCTCSIWYCHSLRVLGDLSVHSLSSHSSCLPTGHQKLWQYHMLHVHNCILLKMSTWGSKHVEENIILWINNNQCIKLVIKPLQHTAGCETGWDIDAFAVNSSFLSVDGITCLIPFESWRNDLSNGISYM